MTRKPMKRRPAKRKDADPEYMSWVHTNTCSVQFCCAVQWPSEVTNRIESHHAGDHGLGQRAPDRTCIPLCAWHHRIGPESVHVLGKKFYAHHGLDRDALIAEYQRRYAEERS